MAKKIYSVYIYFISFFKQIEIIQQSEFLNLLYWTTVLHLSYK